MSDLRDSPIYLRQTGPYAARRRFTALSWVCAASPFALLVAFVTLAIHIRLGLGHWPTPMSEDYHSPAFDVHAAILSFCGMFALYVAGPLWLLCLLVPPLRPEWPRGVVFQFLTMVIGALLMLAVLKFDPTTFTAWVLH